MDVRSFVLLLLTFAASADQALASEATCTDENLLSGRGPSDWRDVFRAEKVTDGICGLEGDPAMGTRSAVLVPGSGLLEFDLGSGHEISSGLLQGSAAALFLVEISSDRAQWATLWAAGPTDGTGLRTRLAKALHGEGRYLRLRVVNPAGEAAVSELQVFCRPPTHLPVALRAAEPLAPAQTVVEAQVRRALVLLGPVLLALLGMMGRPRDPRWHRFALLAASAAFVLGLVFAARNLALAVAVACGGTLAVASLLVGLIARRRATQPPPRRTWASAALLIGVATMAYTNFGRFGGYWSVHYHDVLHYVLGAKYASEVRYDGLYACLLEAHAEEARWTVANPDRVRDLRDDSLVPAAEMAARRACANRFDRQRWQAFRRDAAFFMGQLSPAGWTAVFTDHGYNATPVWTALWAPLLRMLPVSTLWLERLAHLDEAAYAAMVLITLALLGPVRAALLAVFFGFGFPWIALWTGGGLGRSLWLVALVVAIGLAVRRRFWLAGIGLGISSALQLFPVLILAGPLLRAARRREDEDRRGARRLVVAATVTGILLVLLSLPVAGPALWLDFVRNTFRQAASGSVNRIGPAILAAYWTSVAAVHWLLPAVLLVYWARAAWRVEDVARLLCLSVLVPIFALRLSSYYLVMVIGLVPLWVSTWRVLGAVLAFLVIPQIFAWLAHGDPGPGDYAWMSAAVVAFGLWLCHSEAEARSLRAG